MSITATRSMCNGGASWQSGRTERPPDPLKEPSAEVLAQPAVQVPTSNFVSDYEGHELGAYKLEESQGRVHVVSNFQQGFNGRGVERYEDGQTYASTRHNPSLVC